MNELKKQGTTSDMVILQNLDCMIKNGKVMFDQVSSRYPNTIDNVLTSLSFTIEAGMKIGIVGRTGCGKTSL